MVTGVQTCALPIWYKYLFSKLTEFSGNGAAHVEMLEKRLNLVGLLAERVKLQKTIIGDHKYDSYTKRLKDVEFGLKGRIEVSRCCKSSRLVKACRLYFNGGYKCSSGWRSLVVDLLK